MVFPRVFGGHQPIVRNDVGVAVVVDDHVHLRGAGDLLVDLDAVEVVLRKIVPVAMMLVRARLEVFVRLSTHFVEGMQKKASASAGSIEDERVVGDRKHVHNELHDHARREVLAEVAPEERAHERLKRAALAVKIRVLEVDAFQIGNDRARFRRAETNVVLEDLGVFLAPFLIELFSRVREATQFAFSVFCSSDCPLSSVMT